MHQVALVGAGLAAATTITQEALYQKQLQFLLDAVEPEVLGTPGCVLVCDSEEQERAFRPLLDAMGLDYLATRVAAPAPKKWTAEMSTAKEAAGRKLFGRRHAGPAHTPPTTKARKAARKRAKAGRKASR